MTKEDFRLSRMKFNPFFIHQLEIGILHPYVAIEGKHFRDGAFLPGELQRERKVLCYPGSNINAFRGRTGQGGR
jgi:hypothetical protein